MATSVSKNAVACVVGGLIFALFGAFMFPWMVWVDRRVNDMLSWPFAEAEIVRSGVGSSYSKFGGAKYRIDLTYRYTIDSISYVSNRFSFGNAPPRWPSEAEAKRELPAPGSTIRIRYNPKDPSDGVVYVGRVTDDNRRVLQAVVLGLGVTGGLLMCVAGIAWRKEAR